VLAFYPFLFHCCFLIFYWSTSAEILVITQMISLCIFLLGSAHHTLTFAYEILAFAFKLIKECCKNKKISPSKMTKKGKIVVE
jgi:hypothetical protein